MSNLTLRSSNGSITLNPEDGINNVDITIPREGFKGFTRGLVGYFKQVDSTNRSFGTGWALGMTWNNFIKPANTAVYFAATIPMRNDSTTWGGGYTRVEYSINNGSTWTSLGDTGYDTVMEYGQSINHWTGVQIIDKPDIVASTQVKFRFYHRSYDGTMTILTSNGITHGDGYEFGSTQLSLMAIKN